MKKKNLKILKDLADSLPKTKLRVYTTHKVSGYELLKNDENAKDAHGNAIEENLTYRYKTVRIINSNHFSALKSEYSKGGIEAVKKYVADIKKLVAERKLPDSLKQKYQNQ